MIVCLCNGISDSEIKRVAREGGVGDGEGAYAALGCTFQCGSCRCMADALVEDNCITDAPLLMAAE